MISKNAVIGYLIFFQLLRFEYPPCRQAALGTQTCIAWWVLLSWAHERRSREKNNFKKVAPAPISWRFLCPLPPSLLSAPALCLWEQFSKYKPLGGLYSEGWFNGGFFALPVWGAYTWRGLYMEGLIFGILRYYKHVKVDLRDNITSRDVTKKSMDLAGAGSKDQMFG